MTGDLSRTWQKTNFNYLMDEIGRVRHYIEIFVKRLQGTVEPMSDADTIPASKWTLPEPPALESLRDILGLSSFEQDVLLLCACRELDPSFAGLCSEAQGNENNRPTFNLALVALPDAYWDALTPIASLRYWRLVNLDSDIPLGDRPLQIDERILHYLTGSSYLDERLMSVSEAAPENGLLAHSHTSLAERIVSTWKQQNGDRTPPVFQLCGNDIASKRAIAVDVADRLGMLLRIIPAHALPTVRRDLHNLIRLWEREIVLTNRVLLLDCDAVAGSDEAREGAILHFVEYLDTLMIVTSRQRRPMRHRVMLNLDVEKPTVDEQRFIWETVLGHRTPQIDRLIFQFNLSAPAIEGVCADINGQMIEHNLDFHRDNGKVSTMLWDACRMQARASLDNTIQNIEARATWDDLILPDSQLQLLHEIVTQVRQRAVVYETWGFAAKGERGLGISALFAGSSGTGKTLAAEVLAHDLRLDLYRVDLSTIISKYIGETAKNLQRVFEVAEEGGAVLLFDEADAVFGKRSEVRDSHDRYANVEVSYLLQRMEAYHGLAILTSNMKDALDAAFLRRLRFVVQFPFPDAPDRTRIWQGIFPRETPTQKLDFDKLGHLNVSGGNIRNIALNAAFLAAEENQPVNMGHLLRSARSEYTKMEKVLTDAEIRGWI